MPETKAPDAKSPPTITAGRCLAEMLKGYGVTHVFFVDAILRRAMIELEDLGIKRILTHSEKAATYMADGYARVTGRPGICLSQSVGAANLASGLQDPYLGASPVIAITGRHAQPMQYRNAYQEVAHEPLYAAVTKFQGVIETPEQLPLLIRQAFRAATTGTPRPVHLDVAGHTGDVLAAQSRAFNTMAEPEYGQIPGQRPQPDPAAVARAAKAIDAAKRPVIIADRGVTICGAQKAVNDLANKIGAMVICGLDAKGCILEGDPLYGGVVGTYGASSANHIVDEADLVIFAGSGTADMTTVNWRVPREGTAIVQIDIEPTELGRNYAGTIGIQADVKAGLEALVGACAKTARKAWLETAARHVADWQAVVDSQPSGEAQMRPNELCKLLTEYLPQNALFFSDTGWSAQWTGNMIGIRHATQGYHRAAGSLGWSVPAAMGAKAAAPDRPVVVFCGDGGFFYHFPELETARRWGLNVVIVVNNNGGLGQGVRNINATYGNRAGNKEELHRFHPLSLQKIAESLDCWGATVEKASDFAATFKAALACGRPAVIDVRTHPDAAAPDPWIPAA